MLYLRVFGASPALFQTDCWAAVLLAIQSAAKKREKNISLAFFFVTVESSDELISLDNSSEQFFCLERIIFNRV